MGIEVDDQNLKPDEDLDTETTTEESTPPSSQVMSSDPSPSSQDQSDREEDPGLEVSDDTLGAFSETEPGLPGMDLPDHLSGKEETVPFTLWHSPGITAVQTVSIMYTPRTLTRCALPMNCVIRKNYRSFDHKWTKD